MSDLKISTLQRNIYMLPAVVGFAVLVAAVVFGLTHLGPNEQTGPSVAPVPSSAPAQPTPSLGDLLLPTTLPDVQQPDFPFDDILNPLLDPTLLGPADDQAPEGAGAVQDNSPAADPLNPTLLVPFDVPDVLLKQLQPN